MRSACREGWELSCFLEETRWPENTDLQRDLRQVAICVLTEEPDHLRIACYNTFLHTVVLAMMSTKKKKKSRVVFFFFEMHSATPFVKACFSLVAL